MATYKPEQVGVKAPAGGFQQGGWYQGRQYWNGTLSDPNVIHPESNQQGAGQAVSAEVRAQSAAQQGVSPQQFDTYLKSQGATPAQLPGAGQTSAPATSGVSAPGFSTSQPSTPNLSEIYEKLYNTPEIKAKKDELAKMEAERDEAISEVQNNPWYSQATRGGKIAGIRSDSERNLTRVGNELARMQADAQVQYNIQVNQYTLDRQAYQDQLSLFSSLLSAGALTNASGQDLASWSAATGIPTSMMDSIVQAQKTKNLSLQTYDDGSNTYVVALDPSGNVVNKTLIGKSKPAGTSSSDLKLIEQQQSWGNATADIQSGITLQQLIQHYGQPGGFTVEQLYYLYNTANSPYGAAKETLDEVKQGIFVNTLGFVGR